MKEEMDTMKAKMDQMFKLIQGLSLRENNPQPTMIAKDTTWPPYGLPHGYTPPQETTTSTTPQSMLIVIPVTNETPPPQGTPVVQNENTTTHPTVEGTPLKYTITNPPVTNDTPQDAGSTQIYRALEERLKVVEGFSAYEFDAMDMCLVPDVVIPPKFLKRCETSETQMLPFIGILAAPMAN
jgi:hypothetical protein